MEKVTIETQGKYCPKCRETHIHLLKKEDSWKCCKCKHVHDGISVAERFQPAKAAQVG